MEMNWQQFFEANHIDYTTGGKNTSRGWLSISCPMCSGNDPSMHMGCHPSGVFSCWRDASHKGGKPDRLIAALLGVTQGRARVIAAAFTQSSPDEFNAPAGFKTAPESPQPVRLPKEFIPIEFGKLTHKFWQYLWNRGFDDPYKVAEQYGLLACLSGRWSGRLIIPVNHVGWQGRALRTGKDTPRYLTSSPEIKKVLFNQDAKGDVLFICEGPMDSIKLDFYGQAYGARATCLFGATPTTEQIHLLSSIASRFKRIVLLFDQDSAGLIAGYNLSDWIRNVSFGSLPDGVSDPGELSKDQVKEVVNEAQM